MKLNYLAFLKQSICSQTYLLEKSDNDDLATLINLNESIVLEQLKHRFNKNQIYVSAYENFDFKVQLCDLNLLFADLYWRHFDCHESAEIDTDLWQACVELLSKGRECQAGAAYLRDCRAVLPRNDADPSVAMYSHIR